MDFLVADFTYLLITWQLMVRSEKIYYAGVFGNGDSNEDQHLLFYLEFLIIAFVIHN